MAGLARLRRWLRPPRRLRILRPGWALILGTFGVGFATLNTGNNLLYLLLGTLLGVIGVSGWLSERAITGLEVHRRLPRAATAGEPARLVYTVRKRTGRLASAALELREAGHTGGAVVPFVAPGQEVTVRHLATWERRGIVRLEHLVVATAFPFGLFAKERDVQLPGTLVVWPRTDRAVAWPRAAAARGAATRPAPARMATAARGEFRGLRAYRPGDDPRDVHWPSTARAGEPMVREHDPEGGEGRWIVLDVDARPGERAEAALEVAAALAAGAARRGERFGLAAGTARLTPAAGQGQLERALDLLAAVRFRPGAGPPRPPARPERCLLVSVRGGPPGPWADHLGP